MTPKEALNDIVDNGLTCEYFNEKAKLNGKENPILVLSSLVDKFGQIPQSITIEELKKKLLRNYHDELEIVQEEDVFIIQPKKFYIDLVIIDKTSKHITKVDGEYLPTIEETKWLYLMWLNETEIVTEKEKNNAENQR